MLPKTRTICLLAGRALPTIGGLELVVDNLARQFTALGHRVIVVCPRKKWLSERAPTLPYEVIRHRPFISRKYDTGFCKRFLNSLIEREGVDIIHAHELYPQAAIAASCSHETPFVITSHGCDSMTTFRYFKDKTTKMRLLSAVSRASALIAVSDSIAQNYHSLHACLKTSERKPPIVTIPNGVDIEAMAGDAHVSQAVSNITKSKYILFVGRLVNRKGCSTLLKAFSRIQKQEDINLVIAGYGKEEPRLKKLANALGISNHVIFTGPTFGNEKIHLLRHAEALAIPTRSWEACSLVALEGFATRTPVVGSNIVGIADLITDGVNGLLVTPDDVEELASTIRRLLSDSELRDRLATKAYTDVQAYNWQVIARTHLELYEGVIQCNKSSHKRLSA